MTAALTSVGVQQVSITIASGSLTGSATITAVGAGAFIPFNGFNPSDATTQCNDSFCNITLTNSTTVTATRGATGASTTVTVTCVVVDGDTTNLIKSVQFGSISLTTGQSSNTASISAVTNANTAVQHLGIAVSTSITTVSNCEGVFTLSGTTVTFTKQFSGAAMVAKFCVIEFQGAALNSSVQVVDSSANPSAASRTVTITGVTKNNSIMIYGGSSGNSGGSENTIFQNAELTNGTTVTIKTNGSSFVQLRYVCSVVEFISAMLAQSVQHGTIALAAATSNTATIISSNPAQTLLSWLNNTNSLTTLNQNVSRYKIAQTSATVLTMTAGASSTGAGSFQAAQFNPAAPPPPPPPPPGGSSAFIGSFF